MNAIYDDKTMMKSPRRWPCWPFLPLKRGNHGLKDKNLGVLLATQEHEDAVKGKGRFRIYHIYMFDPPKTGEEWRAAPKTEYNTLDELIADGWIVD